jgi:hypothetical protein
MHFGVVLSSGSVHGLAAPTVGYVHESTRKEKIDEKSVRNNLGVTVISEGDLLIEIDVNQRGKGDAQFADVTAGAFTAGTVKLIEAEQDEKADDFPDFNRVGKTFDTLELE